LTTVALPSVVLATGELERRLAKIIEESAEPEGKSAGEPSSGREVDDLIDTVLDLLLEEQGGGDVPRTIDDVIWKSVRARDIDDLIMLNNIVDDREIAEDLEKQNNDETDLNILLDRLTVRKVDSRPFRREKRSLPRGRDYFVVVLDAGHGGIDSGALGALGSKEKDINLEFTRILGKELRKNRRVRVHLLRQGDRYLTIGERITRARGLRANLLISIHSDSNANRAVRGLSVYTLARSALVLRRKKIANRLASQENGGRALEAGLFNSILGLFRRDSFAESSGFADTLVQNFREGNVSMLPRAHRSANFGILLAQEFPSVLIELGFISNSGDEALLRSEEYRKSLAQHIARAVDLHFLSGS
jgi:N-acetylmuramoyl-L-alanine amidase